MSRTRFRVNPHSIVVVGSSPVSVTQNDNVTYFDSFGVEHISKEIRTFIGNKT